MLFRVCMFVILSFVSKMKHGKRSCAVHFCIFAKNEKNEDKQNAGSPVGSGAQWVRVVHEEGGSGPYYGGR